jgi:tetratricopeptide (TPR) repeat protein
MFGRAIALDSNFALAYAELSLAHVWLFRYFVDPTTERLSQARAAVDRALKLDPDLPAAHMALGHYYYWGAVPNPDLALEEFKFVALSEPNNAYARSLIGALQAARGEWDQALENSALAADLDPSEPEWAARAGSFFLLARRYEEAEKYLNRSLALAPDLFEAHLNKIALHLLWHGDEASATQAVKNMGERVTVGQVATALVDVAPVLIAGGDYDTLFTQLTPASISGPFPFDYLYVKAEFHRLRNQPERARVYYDSLLTVLRRVPHERAEDAVVNVLFGLAHAGLGQKTQAIQRAKTIESLVTANEDGLRSNRMLMSLAWIYGMVGDYDAAIDNIQRLLAVPSRVSVPYLRIAELPGNLKQHPRFRQLVNREVELPQTS